MKQLKKQDQLILGQIYQLKLGHTSAYGRYIKDGIIRHHFETKYGITLCKMSCVYELNRIELKKALVELIK